MRAIPVLGVAAWLLWTAAVAWHSFAVPDELFVLTDGPINGVPFWRAAAYENGRAIAGAALVLLAAWGAGAPIARWIGGSQRRDGPGRDGCFASAAEYLTIGMAAGFAVLGAGLFGLALLGLYRPAAAALLIILAAAGGAAAVLRAGLRLPDLPRLTGVDALFASCAAVAAACSFVGALAPESEYDALWYHLWLPSQWLAAGHPVDLVEEYVSLYPLSWDLMSGAAMVFGGPVAAKLLHFACLPLLGLSTFLLTRRLFPQARPMLGAALAMATPITIWEATTAYVDLALAWYLSVSVYAMVRYVDTRDRRWLVTSGLVMSAALAVKHLALVAMAIVSCALAVIAWRGTARAASGTPEAANAMRAVRVVALFVGVSLILPAPWYLRAYAASGNPVFPDLYRVFGASPPERWSPATERGLQAFKDRFGRPRTPGNLVQLPWDATVHAARYGGTIGPLFLILVPAALAGLRIRRRTVVVAAACAAYIAVWASPLSSFQMRFLIPLVPLLAALGAEGAARVERAGRLAWRGTPPVVVTVVSVLILFNLPPASRWHEPDRVGWDGWMTHIVRGLPIAVVAGAESRQSYLARTVPSSRAWQFINATLPADALVLTFSGGDHLYSGRRRLWSDSTLARPATWGTSAGDEHIALAAIRDLGVTHVLFDRRQIEHGGVPLAIGSDPMRRCCLALEYEDDRFVLYRVLWEARTGGQPRPSPRAGAGLARLRPSSDGAAPAASPASRGTARHVCGT